MCVHNFNVQAFNICYARGRRTLPVIYHHVCFIYIQLEEKLITPGSKFFHSRTIPQILIMEETHNHWIISAFYDTTVPVHTPTIISWWKNTWYMNRRGERKQPWGDPVEQYWKSERAALTRTHCWRPTQISRIHPQIFKSKLKREISFSTNKCGFMVLKAEEKSIHTICT